MESNNKRDNSFRGFGLLDVVQIVFIVLKLCKLISWSWWWVLSPIWIGMAILVVVCSVGLIFYKKEGKHTDGESE